MTARGIDKSSDLVTGHTLNGARQPGGTPVIVVTTPKNVKTVYAVEMNDGATFLVDAKYAINHKVSVHFYNSLPYKTKIDNEASIIHKHEAVAILRLEDIRIIHKVPATLLKDADHAETEGT